MERTFVDEFLYVVDHPGFLALTEETWKNRWFPYQIPLAVDAKDVTKLSETDKEFYKFLFIFLGLAEKLVNFNIDELLVGIHSHDAKHYYDEQEAMENIHGKVYANILNLFFEGDKAKMRQYAHFVVGNPGLKAKLSWLHDKVREATTIAEKVLVFLLIEGIFFVSSFYSIGLLRVRGICNGVCLANDYISRDELLHTRAAALLYNTLVDPDRKPPVHWIHNLFREAVDVEIRFIRERGRGVTAVNIEDIISFLKATADRMLTQIKLPILYGELAPSGCPLAFNACVKNINFFEREGTDYSSSVTNDL
ncbi:ribonucleotide reductase small subunit [Cricetid gammaherpesvirus 2]|uniref:ribonucleoside-diphosphate reductase n=1 Tax=Cricetid gammaherpesvirus 2 TaxID=1605972 RepID=E9M5P3_9GAMA|nr:ribonucleotide reductase small subunit [Cricetid gammaherpesvirus 2]ADW24401.1 ribonucleotide reductase small subunit [Cricetid gammaherpesvirus 2]ADW24483.1 ribonucleotide reductase small subunit [Cricetid gammaherpesvirus 2]